MRATVRREKTVAFWSPCLPAVAAGLCYAATYMLCGGRGNGDIWWSWQMVSSTGNSCARLPYRTNLVPVLSGTIHGIWDMGPSPRKLCLLSPNNTTLPPAAQQQQQQPHHRRGVGCIYMLGAVASCCGLLVGGWWLVGWSSQVRSSQVKSTV
jgi:hypothetical protein